jgi:hypothetical protein
MIRLKARISGLFQASSLIFPNDHGIRIPNLLSTLEPAATYPFRLNWWRDRIGRSHLTEPLPGAA